MIISAKQIIGEVVARDYRTAAVFKQSGIDFCCNGNRSIEAACSEMNISDSVVLQQLQYVVSTPTSKDHNYQSWPPDLLAAYIEQIHHVYVRKKIIEIKPYLSKITAVHGDVHPQLHEVKQLFEESAYDLEQHMKKEERILFPFIKKMVKMKTENVQAEKYSFSSVENPIAMMHEEHDTEGERFRKIAALTNNYTVPSDGCNTYRVTLALLKEFEDDLHLHIHLENNILFPQAVQLEKEVFKPKI